MDRTTTPDGCWPWIGALDKSGYGQIEVNGRNRRATHIALELVGFSIPWEGLQVRHYICNNRSCCRYSHLKIGTSKDNIEDRDSQGRQARGERVGGAKLNPVKVREIRRLYTAGGTTYEALGQQFGVSEDNIGHIIRGETWRLGPP